MKIVGDLQLAGYWEGRREGFRKGRADTILQLLGHKCGAVPVSIRKKVQGLSDRRAEALADVVLDFSGLADLKAWLAKK